jgi:F-type H+-transporting ATPase subunit a
MDHVFPKEVFSIFGVPVRDTVVSSWITIVIIVVLAWVLRKTVPTALEMVLDFLRSIVSSVMGDVPAEPYIPFVGTLMIYLVVANNIGIVPLIETPTKDINTPIALAVIVFFAVHVFAVLRKGVLGYLKELATPLVVLDLISQVSRTMSLSIRLFGNILAGEIIVAVIFMLVKPIAPLPMVALSLITGVLQAYIFVSIALSAIATAVQP